MRTAQMIAAILAAIFVFIVPVSVSHASLTQDGTDAPPPVTDAGQDDTDDAPPTDGPADADSDSDDNGGEDSETQEPRRVIIVIDRYATTAGIVEMEDDDIIVIRNRKGEVESYAKGQVLSIIPLLNLTEPQPGVVVMRNSQTQRALIIEDHYDHVIVEIEGIRTTFDRETVSHVTLEPTFEERYRELRRTIPTGSRKHLDLCKWLMDHQRYDLAVNELEQLMDAGAPDEEAPQLLRIARAQLILMEDEKPQLDEEPGDDATAHEENEAREILDELSSHMLTAEDVNTVRVYEIDFRNPPRVVVQPETIRRIQEQYGTSPLIPADASARTRMFRADDIELVRLMFELRARDLYPEIEVQSEPFALNQFRDKVHHAWLITNCATSRCHGGPDGGRLFLHNRRIRDSRVWMSNLLTLERLEIDPVHPLINYDNPEMSLLLQYALNPNEARMPHPDVRGYRAVFPRKNRQFWESVGWIDSMMQPRPTYPVEYDPPIPPAARVLHGEPGGRTDR